MSWARSHDAVSCLSGTLFRKKMEWLSGNRARGCDDGEHSADRNQPGRTGGSWRTRPTARRRAAQHRLPAGGGDFLPCAQISGSPSSRTHRLVVWASRVAFSHAFRRWPHWPPRAGKASSGPCFVRC